MKVIKRILVISSIICIVILICLVALIFCGTTKLINLFNALFSLFTTVTFGFGVSYIFQKHNDKKLSKQNETIKKEIRNRELLKIRKDLANLVRCFFQEEDSLISEIKGLKSSFTKDTIDTDNFSFNCFVFNEIYNNIDQYFTDEEAKTSFKKRVEILFMKDKLGFRIIAGEELLLPSIYCEFLEFNDECVRLSYSMPQLNLEYQINIFTDNEIKAISCFSQRIGIGLIVKTNTLYNIIKILENLNRIECFVHADYIPYYKKNNIYQDLVNQYKQEEELRNKINEWYNDYQLRAKKFLKGM